MPRSDSDTDLRMLTIAEKACMGREDRAAKHKRNGIARLWTVLGLLVTVILVLGGGVVRNFGAISGMEKQIELILSSQVRVESKVDQLGE